MLCEFSFRSKTSLSCKIVFLAYLFDLNVSHFKHCTVEYTLPAVHARLVYDVLFSKFVNYEICIICINNKLVIFCVLVSVLYVLFETRHGGHSRGSINENNSNKRFMPLPRACS